MIELTMYQCEVCGDRFGEEGAAIECEKKHLQSPAIEGLIYKRGAVYPRSVEISFENGKTVIYSNVSIITTGEA